MAEGPFHADWARDAELLVHVCALWVWMRDFGARVGFGLTDCYQRNWLCELAAIIAGSRMLLGLWINLILTQPRKSFAT